VEPDGRGRLRRFSRFDVDVDDYYVRLPGKWGVLIESPKGRGRVV